MYDNCRQTAIKNNSKIQTTSAALKKMLNGSKKQLQDVNTVIINSWNDKPLMIKVNGDSNKGLLEYNNYFSNKPKTPWEESRRDFLKMQELAHSKREINSSQPQLMNDLQMLKTRFSKVLDGYKQREKMLLLKCRYLEKELFKAREGNNQN